VSAKRKKPPKRHAQVRVADATTGRRWFATETAWLARHAQLPSAVVGTHLRLRGACAARLNGGRLAGAKAWTARDWFTGAHVDRDEVDAVVAAGLARWESQDLLVADYDSGPEEVYRARVERVAEARSNRDRARADVNGRHHPLKSETGINGSNQRLKSEAEISREGEGEGDPGLDLDLEEEREREGDLDRSPPASLALSEPDRNSFLAALRSGYRAAREAELPPLDSRDRERTVVALAGLGDPDVAEEVVRLFFVSDGSRPGDRYWCERGHPIHLLASQAISAFSTRAQEVVADRRRVVTQQQADAERRAAKAAAQAAADQRAVEELAALPPVMRSWREVVNAISARRPRVGAILATADVVEGAGGLTVTICARDQGSVSGCWAEIESDFAARAPGVGLELLSDEFETVRDAAHV